MEKKYDLTITTQQAALVFGGNPGIIRECISLDRLQMPQKGQLYPYQCIETGYQYHIKTNTGEILHSGFRHDKNSKIIVPKGGILKKEIAFNMLKKYQGKFDSRWFDDDYRSNNLETRTEVKYNVLIGFTQKRDSFLMHIPDKDSHLIKILTEVDSKSLESEFKKRILIIKKRNRCFFWESVNRQYASEL